MHPRPPSQVASQSNDPTVPSLLSSLLHRTQRAILVLLLLVLPLQSIVQLGAGIRGHRHVHVGAAEPARQAFTLASLTQPLRAVLDCLHAAQDPGLQGPAGAWALSRGPAEGWHEHGGVMHRHSLLTADAVDVGDAGDGSMPSGATAFLAWLPAALPLPAATASVPPAAAARLDPGRVIAPPLAPPRG